MPDPVKGTPAAATVSVVVPTLNGVKYLPEALASLAAQTSPAVEVVVVDGGSTDGTVEFLENWSAEHPIRWVSGKDNGQAAAINKGFAMAQGEVVGWLNADDTLEPETCAIAAQRFAADPALGFLWGFCLVIDASGRPLYIQNPFVRADFSTLRHHRNFVPQPGSWFRRSVTEESGPLDESYDFMFDYEYFLRLAGRVSALFVPRVLARFRLHTTSKTGRSHRRFLAEERRAFRAHGGRIASPFFFDYLRYLYIVRPLDVLKAPARRLLWRLLDLDRGSRIRP